MSAHQSVFGIMLFSTQRVLSITDFMVNRDSYKFTGRGWTWAQVAIDQGSIFTTPKPVAAIARGLLPAQSV
jgi:hypothetical protein